MGIKKKYIANVKKPQSNIYGRAQLKSMNNRHNKLALWGLAHIEMGSKKMMLDVGCGGGKNIANMLIENPNAKVYGVDYSEESVKMSKKLNNKAIKSGNSIVKVGKAEDIPFDDNQFDLVTAFETIYFWDIGKGFSQVYRLLKNGGQFLIVNEAQNKEGSEELMKTIGFDVYDSKQIKSALEKESFKNIVIDLHENGKWLAVVAEK